MRALGLIEGEPVEIRKLSERVSKLEQWQSWLKGGWAVQVCSDMPHPIHALCVELKRRGHATKARGRFEGAARQLRQLGKLRGTGFQSEARR